MALKNTNLNSSYSPQPRQELLQVAEAVAREKGIEREEVLQAMEQAMQKSAKTKYGNHHTIKVLINRSTGAVSIYKVLTVVQTVEDVNQEISLEDARHTEPHCTVGQEILEELPPLEFGRVAAQSARQVIVQKVRDAERSKQFEEFKDKVGQITSGLVKRVEFGNVILDLGRAEGILRRDDIIGRETFRTGDRVRVYIVDIRPEQRGPMIILSRTHPQFMAKLFEQEVPEIYDNVIEIKSVARDPGSRAKIAVYSADTSIDPVGSCVGMRGARVQAVVTELQGEKIDIVLWSPNPAVFVVNALAPAEVVKVVLDEDNKRVDVVVADDQLSLAIGRRGQNVRLATQLTGWNIDILTEAQEASRRAEEYGARTKLFIQCLDVDEMIAQLLAAEGFATIEDIADAPLSDFSSIEGFDDDIAAEIQSRAIVFLEQQAAHMLHKAQELGLDKNLLALKELTEPMLLKLVQHNVKTRDDLADLSGDELVDILGEDIMPLEQANQLIMSARAHWFENDKEA